MMKASNNSELQPTEERVSILEMFQLLWAYLGFLRQKWLILLGGQLILSILLIAYFLLRAPLYTAETTFVVQSSSGSSDNISSLAGVVGINLNALSEESTLFQEDNILELYKSRRMIYETFVSSVPLPKGDSTRLITYWAKEKEVLPKWRKHLKDMAFSFDIPLANYTVKHDSLLFEVIQDFKEENLLAQKPDRLLSILSVQVKTKDPFFAKHFNEILVQKVNDFYFETETKKTGENLKVLSRQADSVRRVLEQTMLDLAIFNEQQPNLNPLYRQVRLPKKKIELDLQANATIYQEVVKNLEIAKITHRNNAPLIQVIDKPRYPLPDNGYSTLKAIVFGLFLGGFLMVCFLTLQYIWKKIQYSLAT